MDDDNILKLEPFVSEVPQEERIGVNLADVEATPLMFVTDGGVSTIFEITRDGRILDGEKLDITDDDAAIVKTMRVAARAMKDSSEAARTI